MTKQPKNQVQKYMQVRQDGEAIEPKILEMGKDFNLIHEGRLYKCKFNSLPELMHDQWVSWMKHYYTLSNKEIKNSQEKWKSKIKPFNLLTEAEKLSDYQEVSKHFELIAKIEDCYQQRPLIQVDGFCEFDVILNCAFGAMGYDDRQIYLIDKEKIAEVLEFGKTGTFDKGSISKPENKAKFPKLYQEFLKTVRADSL